MKQIIDSNLVAFAAAVVMGVLWVVIATPLKIYEWWHNRQLIKYGPPAPPAGVELGGGDDDEDDGIDSERLYQDRKRKGRFQKYKR